MSYPVINPELIKEENQPATPFLFTLTCPKYQTLLTPNDFDNNHFTIMTPN